MEGNSIVISEPALQEILQSPEVRAVVEEKIKELFTPLAYEKYDFSAFKWQWVSPSKSQIGNFYIEVPPRKKDVKKD